MQIKQVIYGIFSIARALFGFIWLQAGYNKLTGGFSVESLVPVIAMNTDTPDWYKHFFANIVDPYSSIFDWIIPWGELFIGLCLINGLLITPTLTLAIFVHVNYILADMIFTYPLQILIATLFIVFRKSCSYISIDCLVLNK